MSANPIIVFDIDGTLTQSHDIDCELFFETIAEEIGIGPIEPDLSPFPDVTDSGIVHQLYLSHKNRQPTVEEFFQIEDRFADRLSSAVGSSIFYEKMHGAIEFIEKLESQGLEVGIATGNWRKSGAIKLKSLGLERLIEKAATSSDSRSRKEILAIAFEKFRHNSNGSRWYIGDGQWDLTAAQGLGVSFFGIGQKLKDHKLKHWAQDFAFYEDILKVILEN